MPIELNSFFDQAASQQSGYKDPRDVLFEDGSNFARYIPSSVGGKQMSGVVIPHARPLGGSRAYDPHHPPHKRVHIDPHIEGQSIVVDLGQITPDIAEEAMALGQEYADQHADKVHGIDQLRLRSAAAFHLIGASQRANGTAPVQAEPSRVITVPREDAQPPAPSMPRPASRRDIRAATFGGPAPAASSAQPVFVDTGEAQRRGGLLDAYQQPRPQHEQAATLPMVAPPAVKVTFGVPGFGLHEACYHDVLVGEQQFVLVYDERYKGGGKFLPNQIEGSFAARVAGDPVDYQLVWPDQSFTDPTTSRTYFILLIEKRVPQGEAT